MAKNHFSLGPGQKEYIFGVSPPHHSAAFVKSYAFKFISPCAGQAVLLKQKNQNFGGFDSPEPLNDISGGEALGVYYASLCISSTS